MKTTNYSRTVTVRIKGDVISSNLREVTVSDCAFLSRSRACFMALDQLAQWHARSRMTIESVSELSTEDATPDSVTAGEIATGTE